MKIFSISDLHLAFSVNKPMDIFGEKWQGHAGKIADSWRACVGADDVVLVAGDVSWAMRLREAEADFAWLRSLPGKKVFIRGNHDYWWESVKKNTAAAGDNMYFIHNNAVVIGEVAIAGSRLWNYPYIKWPFAVKDNPALVAAGKKTTDERGADDEKVRASELGRLQLSLSQLPAAAGVKICLTHFPPVSLTPEANPLTDMISAAGVDICLYGHVHGLDVAPAAADCKISGVQYWLTAADYLDFQLKLIKEL